MRIEIRFDHDIGTIGSEVEGCVVAAIIQISGLLDQYSLAGNFVQSWQRFQLVSVVLYLVHHSLGGIVIYRNRHATFSDRRVLRNVERSIGHAIQIHSDIKPFGDQFNIIQMFNFDLIVHRQVIDAVLAEFYFEWFLAHQVSRLFLWYVDFIVVRDVDALSSDVSQMTEQSIRACRSTEEVHHCVVGRLNSIVVHRSGSNVHLYVEHVLWSIFPDVLVDRHPGH